jgi:hypothetical protein
MRIGPTFTAVVAITLVGAADVHSDGSGLAEQTRRSAQPRQLAQAPEPPPLAQPGAENPPSMAPAPPAGAPPNPVSMNTSQPMSPSALKNTFPASDPVSVEQPTTSGRACRS